MNVKITVYHKHLRIFFDTEYTYPEPARRNLTQIPGGDSASVYINLTIMY